MKWMLLTAVLATLALLAYHVAEKPDTRALMEDKTLHAQNILKHLAEADLGKVKAEAESLEDVTRQVGFANESEEYQEYGQQFLRIVRALKSEAAQGNLAGSYYQFSRMTGVCFACHDNLRDKRG